MWRALLLRSTAELSRALTHAGEVRYQYQDSNLPVLPPSPFVVPYAFTCLCVSPKSMRPNTCICTWTCHLQASRGQALSTRARWMRVKLRGEEGQGREAKAAVEGGKGEGTCRGVAGRRVGLAMSSTR